MAQIAVRSVLLANESRNVLQGSQYEFLPPALYPRGAYVEFGGLADATGVLRTVQTGSDVVEEESPLSIGLINTTPTYPDHYTLNDLVGPGERIKVAVRDTTGVPRTVLTVVRFTAL